MTDQNFNINDLIAQLQTDDGTLAATVMAIGKGIEVSPTYVDKLREVAQSGGAYNLLLKISKSPDDIERALASYDSKKRKAYESEVRREKHDVEIFKRFENAGLFGNKGLFSSLIREADDYIQEAKTKEDVLRKSHTIRPVKRKGKTLAYGIRNNSTGKYLTHTVYDKRRDLYKQSRLHKSESEANLDLLWRGSSSPKYLYNKASDALCYGLDFVNAYKLRLDIGEQPSNVQVPKEKPWGLSTSGLATYPKRAWGIRNQIDRVYVGGIMFYEQNGMFREAAKLETLRGNEDRARAYQTLSLLLER